MTSEKYTTILEVKRFKRECEERMMDAVREFEEKTDLSVNDIDMNYVKSNDGKVSILDITIEVKL